VQILHELHEKGSTIVMVTHEYDIADQTQRILHIRDGKLESDNNNGHRAKAAKQELRQTLSEALEGEKL
jgi:ABC-type lipoprotein export system ATPase subunit